MQYILPVAFALSVAAAAVYLYIGCAIAIFVSKRRPAIDYSVKEQTKKTGIDKLCDAVTDCKHFVDGHITDRVTVTASDGTVLSGIWIKHPNEQAVAVMMHGYRSTSYNDFPYVLRQLYCMGFSLMLPDQRAHGGSMGNRICFGAKEHADLMLWIEKSAELSGDNTPILLWGLSMGATSVLLALKNLKGTRVRAAVADCGFTSPAEILAHLLKKHYPLPKLLLPSVALWTKVLCGYNIYSYSTVRSLSESDIPVLFFHGSADKIVPPAMTESEFSACASQKECMYVEGAKHGMAFAVDTDGCTDRLKSFIEKYVFGGNK